MYIVTVLYVTLAVLIFLLFVAEPREVGIEMNDDHLSVTSDDKQTDQGG